jgi:hypothetical protein
VVDGNLWLSASSGGRQYWAVHHRPIQAEPAIYIFHLSTWFDFRRQNTFLKTVGLSGWYSLFEKMENSFISTWAVTIFVTMYISSEWSNSQYFNTESTSMSSQWLWLSQRYKGKQVIALQRGYLQLWLSCRPIVQIWFLAKIKEKIMISFTIMLFNDDTWCHQYNGRIVLLCLNLIC